MVCQKYTSDPRPPHTRQKDEQTSGQNMSPNASNSGKSLSELILGKRKHTPPCSSAELFFAEKMGSTEGKISVVDMVFLVFMGFLYPPPAWESFSLRPEKFSKRFSFGGGCVRVFFSEFAKITVTVSQKIIYEF